jgi:predicted permease
MAQTLFVQIIPLLILIGLGYFAGRKLDVNLHSLAAIAIYILAPFVNFGAMANIDLDPAYASLPFVSFVLSFIVSSLSYYVAKRVLADETRNLVGLASVSGNTGYFGLPLVIALLGPEWVGVYLMINLGSLIAEATIGYYMAARGHFSMNESIKKVLKLPVFYAVIAGLMFNFMQFPLPEVFDTYWTYAAGAWVLIGMMLIGVALSKTGAFVFGPRMITHLFIVKFMVWPCIVITVLLLDSQFLGLYGEEVYLMALIYGLVPLAGNPVAYAAQLGLKSERIAMAVLLSTLFALIYMPAVLYLLMKTSLFGA